MKNPFVYGEEVSGDAFWNRTKEIQDLVLNIYNSQNVIIFPRSGTEILHRRPSFWAAFRGLSFLQNRK